ncbi:hypothetical protein BT67DRAFT_111609 [Trichocladium antarcticum]|uniref:Uncharacterized protein n=1 Tax=Trichocladium antarcticum TaxID=1450529 RepID=A0AAN6URH4_9PEZI|nr:hypothetical protein BT67DRAFT_111609 [Trichocladium antarcticum]
MGGLNWCFDRQSAEALPKTRWTAPRTATTERTVATARVRLLNRRTDDEMDDYLFTLITWRNTGGGGLRVGQAAFCFFHLVFFFLSIYTWCTDTGGGRLGTHHGILALGLVWRLRWGVGGTCLYVFGIVYSYLSGRCGYSQIHLLQQLTTVPHHHCDARSNIPVRTTPTGNDQPASPHDADMSTTSAIHPSLLGAGCARSKYPNPNPPPPSAPSPAVVLQGALVTFLRRRRRPRRGRAERCRLLLQPGTDPRCGIGLRGACRHET